MTRKLIASERNVKYKSDYNFEKIKLSKMVILNALDYIFYLFP